jgi:hypothetical protein
MLGNGHPSIGEFDVPIARLAPLAPAPPVALGGMISLDAVEGTQVVEAVGPDTVGCPGAALRGSS